MSNTKKAIVTGASSGIGSVFAERLADRGYDLILVARRTDRLDALALELGDRFDVKIETLRADLTNPEDLRAVEQKFDDESVCLLVNNAGAGALGPLAARGSDAQVDLIHLNIIALVQLSAAALNCFSKSGRGDLINISSVMALAPSAGGATYSGSKAFVLNFTRSLQLEYAESAIRIQAVLPGPVKTEFFSSQGMDDSTFPPTSYLTADQVVDATLTGLDEGEDVTIPSLEDSGLWDEMDAQRNRFMKEVLSGRVATRYIHS